MAVPQLPSHLSDHSLSETELAKLWHDIVVELLDEKYANRTHGNRRTYDAGCHKPLCSKGLREHARRRNNTSPNEKYKYVDAIIEYYWPIAVDRIESVRATMLDQLIS
jgi:hypothetical protein